MAALRHDLQCEQGATYSFVYTYRNSAGAAVDLTGFTARMTIRRGYLGSVEMDLTTTNGRIALGGSAGTVTLSLTAAETAGFLSDLQSARDARIWSATNQSSMAEAYFGQRGPLMPKQTVFVYDLELVSASGVVTRILQGRFLLSPESTE